MGNIPKTFFDVKEFSIKRDETIFDVAAVAIAVTSARRERPCGGGRNIESCVCADEEETEVSKPWQCRRVQARPESCSCVDGSEWTPTGPCEGESFDIEFCECDDGTEVNEP